MVWVLDRSLVRLTDQVNSAAPGRSKASDGSLGDPAHQATVSAHNPEDTEDSSDRNDPDNQVDAKDITHDPRFPGSDMRIVTEGIRQSRDRRIRLVIFNKRIFSSYPTSSRPAWAWGPYIGSNDHSKHAHVETNDVYNDQTHDWVITALGGSTMVTDLDYEGWTVPPKVGGRPAALLLAEAWTDIMFGEGAYGGTTQRQAQLIRLEAGMNKLLAESASDAASNQVMITGMKAIADQIKAGGGGSIEIAPIITAMQEFRAASLAQFTEMQHQIEELRGERDQLATDLSAAYAKSAEIDISAA